MSREAALQLLAGASQSDRHWILRNLSDGARARLATAHTAVPLGGAGPATSAEVVTGLTSELTGKLEAADPAHIGDLLRVEPGWLVSIVLRAHAWPWARKVRERLPAHLRAEIARLERSRLSLPPVALDLLMRELALRLDARAPALSPQTPFDSLLTRFKRGRR